MHMRLQLEPAARVAQARFAWKGANAVFVKSSKNWARSLQRVAPQKNCKAPSRLNIWHARSSKRFVSRLAWSALPALRENRTKTLRYGWRCSCDKTRVIRFVWLCLCYDAHFLILRSCHDALSLMLMSWCSCDQVIRLLSLRSWCCSCLDCLGAHVLMLMW